MTPFQRIIKYLAVAFALFLVISIFSGIFGALGLVSGLVGSEPAGETRSYPVTGEIENLDLEISAAALKIIPGGGAAEDCAGSAAQEGTGGFCH